MPADAKIPRRLRRQDLRRGHDRRVAMRTRPRTAGQIALYAISLPERLIRSAAGFVGMVGLAVARLLPDVVRRTRIYRFVVERQLRILTDDLGGAQRFPGKAPLDAKTAARLGLGGALDNAAILTLHFSPLWILLAAKDATDGARALISDVLDELKDAGLVQPGSRLDKTEALLGALAKLSERAGDAIDCPPLSVDDLKRSLQQISDELVACGRTAVQDVAQLEKLVSGVRKVAADSKRSLLDVMTGLAVATAGKSGRLVLGTSTAAVASVRAVSRRFYTGVVRDYQSLLDDIADRGLFCMMAETLAPHVRAAERNFAFAKLTTTENLLTRGRYRFAPWRLRAAPGPEAAVTEARSSDAPPPP